MTTDIPGCITLECNGEIGVKRGKRSRVGLREGRRFKVDGTEKNFGEGRSS